MKWHKFSLLAFIFLFSLCADVNNSFFEYEILQVELYNVKDGVYLINSEEDLSNFFIDSIEEKDPFYKLATTEVILKKVDFEKNSLIILPRERCQSSYCEETITKVEEKGKIIIHKEITTYSITPSFEETTTPHVIVITKSTKSIEVKILTKSE
jgi:hypothetical protein